MAQTKQQIRLDVAFDQAVKNNLFTGSRDEFVSRMQTDPSYFSDIKTMFLDLRKNNGVTEETPSDSAFSSFIGLEVAPTEPNVTQESEKKKETGSEESSAPGSAETDQFDQVINSFASIQQEANNQSEYLRAIVSGEAPRLPGGNFSVPAASASNLAQAYSEEPNVQQMREAGLSRVDRSHVIDNLLKNHNPSNIDQSLEALEALSGSELKNTNLVPTLTYMFGALGLKFEASSFSPQVTVTTPDNESRDFFGSQPELKDFISDYAKNKRAKAVASGDRDYDIPERILNRGDYERITAAYAQRMEQQRSEEEVRENTLRTSLASIQDKISSVSQEASSIAQQLKASYSNLNEKVSQINSLREVAESENATEEDINAYNSAVEDYQSARETFEQQSQLLEDKKSQIEVLNNGNPMLRVDNESIAGLTRQYEEESKKRNEDLLAFDHLVNYHIAQYTTRVTENQWTWTGATATSIVNGVENVINGLTTLGGMTYLGALEGVKALTNLSSNTYRMIGLSGVANAADAVLSTVYDGIEDFVFDGDASVEGVMNKSQNQAYYVSQLSDVLGGTSDAAIRSIKEQSFVGGAVLGAAESLPAMVLGGPATTLGFFSMSFDSNMKEMNSPEFSDMTTSNKLAVASIVGVAEAALESLGMPRALGGTGLFSSLVKEAVEEVGGNFSASVFRSAITSKLKSIPKEFLADVAGEGVTGGLQYMSETAIKELNDYIIDNDLFDGPENAKEFFFESAKAFGQEAIGGAIFSGFGSIPQAVRQNKLSSVSDALLNMVAQAGASGGDTIRIQFQEKLNAELKTGKISQESYDQSLADFDMMFSAVRELPSDGEGAIAANAVQIRALVELQLRKAMLGEATSDSERKTLENIESNISTIEEESKRTHAILSRQNETASSVEFGEGDEISIENLTDSEIESLTELFNDFKATGGQRLVIHQNQKSADAAGLDAAVGGRYENGIVHINIQAIERNKIEEAGAGFMKLKGFSETLQEEIGHAMTSQAIMTMPMEEVNALLNSFKEWASSDKAVSARMKAKEQLYREAAILKAAGLDSSSMNQAEVDDAISKIKLTEEQQEAIDREIADEIIQEIGSFANTGRLDESLTVRARAAIGGALTKAGFANNTWSNMNKAKDIATTGWKKLNQAGKRLSQDDKVKIIQLAERGQNLKAASARISRDNKGLSPSKLPNKKFVVRVKYPGITTSATHQRYQVDKEFKDKWDFVNYFRQTTKDGHKNFFAFELIDKVGGLPTDNFIDAYRIAGWNFKNSYKPISSSEATVAINEAITDLESKIEKSLPFDEARFYEMAAEVSPENSTSIGFSSFVRQYARLDLLIKAKMIDPKTPFDKFSKGRIVGEQKDHNEATIAARTLALNSREVDFILNSLSPQETMELADVAKLLYPNESKKEETIDAVIRNSTSLTKKDNILSGVDYLNAVLSMPESLKSELIATKKEIVEFMGTDYRDFTWSNYEELGMLLSNLFGGDINGENARNLSSSEQAQVIASIADYVESKGYDAASQFKEYNNSKKSYFDRLISAGFDNNVTSFSPVLDLLVAITSNGETESKNTRDALMIFEMVMTSYKHTGTISIETIIKKLEEKGVNISSNRMGRKGQIMFQLRNMEMLVGQFISDDGSFKAEEFKKWASSYPEKTKERGFTNLHQFLIAGSKVSVDQSNSIKIPNYALNLMGVESVLTIDTHSTRAIQAINGGWRDGAIESWRNGNLIDPTAKRKITEDLRKFVNEQISEGKTKDQVIATIKSALTRFNRGKNLIPIIHNKKQLEISVSDFVNGNMSAAKTTEETGNDALWAGYINAMRKAESPIRDSARKVFDKTIGSRAIIQSKQDKKTIASAESTIRESWNSFNQKREQEGKSKVSLAGFGQYLFVFGKLNNSKTYKPLHTFVDERTPMSSSRNDGNFFEGLESVDVYADVDMEGLENMSLYTEVDMRKGNQPFNLFTFIPVFRRNGDIDAEAYPTYEDIPYIDNVKTQTNIQNYGSENQKTDSYLNTGIRKGVQIYKFPWGEGKFMDGNMREVEQAENIKIIETNSGGTFIYADGRLKLTNTDLKVEAWNGFVDGKGGEIELGAFSAILEAATNRKYSEEQVEEIYKTTASEWRKDFVQSGQSQAIYDGLKRNSIRLRQTARNSAKSTDLSSVRQDIVSNPQNYISKQNIKEAKQKLEEMTNDDLLAIMTDDALGRLQNRNDDLGVLAGAELIQRKVDQGDLDGVPAIVEELAKMGTTAGRILRHFKELNRSTPQGMYSVIEAMIKRNGNKLNENQQARLRRLTEDLMKNQARLKELMDRATRGENVEDDLKIAKRDLDRVENELNTFLNSTLEKSWSDIGVALMQGNLLTPMSQFTNIGANLVNAFIKVPVDLVSMPIVKIAEALNMHIDKKHRLSFAAYLYGLRRFGAGFVEAADQIVTGKEESGTEWRVNRGFMPIRSFMAAWSKDNLPLNMYDKQSASQRTKLFVQGTLGVPAEVMFRFLSLGDTPFRRMVEGFELYQMGLNKGLSGEDLKKFLKYPNKEDQQYAEREGRKLTFQEETTASKAADEAVSFFERMFAKAFDWIPGVNGQVFSRFFVRANMPYVRTPANILYDTLTFVTPYVAVPRILGSIAKGDNKAAAENTAKLIIGTTIMQSTAKLVSLGLISGAIEWDEDEEKNIAYDQFPPNSINISALNRWVKNGDASKKEDDMFVGYNKLGVLGAIMGATVASTTRESVQESDPFTVNRILRDAFGINAFGSIAYMMDQSFLQGMNNFISVVSATDPDDFERTFERWYGTMFQAVSSIALPNTMSAYNRSDREYLPDTRITKDLPLEERLIKKMEYTIRDRIGDNSRFPIRVDWRGEDISQTPRGTTGFAYQFYDITKSRQGNADEVSQEVWRLYEETEQLTKVVGTPYYATTRKLNVPAINSRNKKEREAFERFGGKYTFLEDADFTQGKVYLSTAEINKVMAASGKERYAMVRSLMISDDYKLMTDKERVEALDKINDSFNGFKELDENGNFRSHTVLLLDILQERYEQLEDE